MIIDKMKIPETAIFALAIIVVGLLLLTIRKFRFAIIHNVNLSSILTYVGCVISFASLAGLFVVTKELKSVSNEVRQASNILQEQKRENDSEKLKQSVIPIDTVNNKPYIPPDNSTDGFVKNQKAKVDSFINEKTKEEQDFLEKQASEVEDWKKQQQEKIKNFK